MDRRFAAIFLIVFMLFSTTGCWSRREIEKLAMGTVLGHDKVEIDGEEKWMISTNIIKPRALANQGPLGGGMGQQDSPTLLVSSLGATAWEAGRNLATRLPRHEYIAHANIIIIGEEVAREGVDQVIDNFLRSKDIRLNTWIVVAKGKAIDVLKVEPEMERLLSQEIMGLIQNESVVSKAFTIDVKRFVNKLITPGQDAVASCIEVFQRQDGDQSQPDGSLAKGSGQKALRMVGTSVFRQGKLVGWLDDEETKGYLYAIGKAGQGTISLSVHESDKKDLVFLMSRSKSKIIPKVDDGEISFVIDIHAEGDILEHEDIRPLANLKTVKEIEEKVAEAIKAMVEKAINKAQNEFEADIFGLGNRLHKKYPQIWKKIEQDWRDIYPDIKVTVKVKAEIRRTGMITDTPIIR